MTAIVYFLINSILGKWTKSIIQIFFQSCFQFVIPAKTGIQNIMKTIHKYYVYILASQRNGTLYIGMTNDLQRGVYEHKTGTIKGFTQKYGVSLLIYFEEFQHVQQAIERENNLKKWKRAWKLKLIEEENPNWDDLAKDWYDDLLID